LIFTEKFLANRDWLRFFACAVASGCLLILWHVIPHLFDPPALRQYTLWHLTDGWGWRHYVGVVVNNMPAVLALATVLWLLLRSIPCH
jgi:hypothetical protein